MYGKRRHRHTTRVIDPLTGKPTSRPITPKCKVFCEEYLLDLNGTAAAIRAGYSPRSAQGLSTRNLGKPEVQEYIQQLMAERGERTQIGVDRVLQEIGAVALSDIRRLFDEDGNIRQFHKMPDDIAPAISSIKVTTNYDPRSKPDEGEDRKTYLVEVKLWDKGKHLDMAARHLKLYGGESEETFNNFLTFLRELPNTLGPPRLRKQR